MLEEFRVVITNLVDWMANSSPSWAAYLALMSFRLIALYKRPGVHPVGIWETLRWSIAKLVMRAAGDQAKMECGSLQLYAGLGDSIEGATHTVAQRRCDRHMLEPGGGIDEGSKGAEYKILVAAIRMERAGEAERFRVIG